MAAEITHVADLDHAAVTRLPLNVERLVESVRKLIGTVVIGERE
jgi:hypothetical protein